MKNRLLKIGLTLLLLGALGGTGFHFWRKHVKEKMRAEGLATAGELLKADKPKEAIAALRDLRRQGVELTGAEETEARRLELAAAAATGDLPRLLDLQRRRPDLVAENERASLLVVRAMRAYRPPAPAADEGQGGEKIGEKIPEVTGAPSAAPASKASVADAAIEAEVAAAEKLRESWNGRAAMPEAWLCLDADALLAKGQRAEAQQLLESATFPGKADSGRLLRLAMMNTGKPAEAIRWFEQAYKADPQNPDLRSFRGQILEGAGEYGQARVEYTAALVARPENPLLRDQLAEFYLRRKNFPAAMQTMSDALREKPAEFMRVKAEFWSKVSEPIKDRPAPAKGAEAQNALANFIVSLPNDRFWDAAAFEQLPNSKVFQTRQPEVFWLSLLENLRTGKEKEAMEMMESNPFSRRGPQVDMEHMLVTILRYRLNGARPGGRSPSAAPLAPGHQFFESLVNWKRDEPQEALEAFIKGPHAFAAACLAAGWTEAALTMTSHVDPAEPEATAPEWFRYGIAQCLRRNRGAETALAFLQTQPGGENMKVLRAETEIAAGHRETALPLLTSVATNDSDAGFRAAWLLAMDAAERGDFTAARGFVNAQPRLSGSVTGKECLARWDLAEGKDAEAAALYTAISAESAEAKMYLSRAAYTAKNWTEARRLTNELLQEMPDELALRRNLAAIDEASAKP